MKLTSRRNFLKVGSVPLLLSLLPQNKRILHAQERKSAGYFKVESRDGIWWFIDPAGKPIISLGANHTEQHLMLMSYNRSATLERYGQDFVNEDGTFNPTGEGARKWVNQVVADLEDWGFNSFAFHNDLPRPLFKDKMFFVQPITPIWITPYRRPTEFTDVFSAEVAARIDNGAREVCLAYKDEPNLIGYVYNDRPRYSLSGGPQRTPLAVHPWVEVLRTLGPDAAGKQKWIEVLKSRHADAQSAGKTHGTEVATWDELLARTEWPNPENSSEADADKLALLTLIVEQWFKLHCEAIRRYDPNHLILGDKLGGGFSQAGTRVEGHPNIPEYMYPTLKKYVDVVTIEWYGRFDEQVTALRNIHKATGKPILLGDSSFSELQPQQKDCKGIRVNSQQEVGGEYTRYLQQAMAEPFILGWHFCGYNEGYTDPNRPSQFQAQNGFKDPFDKVHEEAIVLVRAANRQAKAWHEKAQV